MNKNHPRVNIDRLREIGWSLWDPIGLKEINGAWKGQPFEDEYDTYLVKAAGLLRNNCEVQEVVEYLFFIESDYMGLGPAHITAQHNSNLMKVVQAIAEDPYIWCAQKV